MSEMLTSFAVSQSSQHILSFAKIASVYRVLR